MVDVQAILYASLTISFFSAFLAMLGKQWLNRYASTDMRGSAIERSQNRQRKLDGIVAWYFNSVMESLPLMLQIALLLLGCALSRYLWEISITIASVVLGVTSFGVLFYIFIVIAGAVSEGCPYQTPGSQAIRYLVPRVPSMGSALGSLFGESEVINTIIENLQHSPPWRSRADASLFFFGYLTSELPPAFAADVRCLGRAIIWAPYHLVCRVCTSLWQRLNPQTSPPDFRCISWTLQTSLDTSVHLLTLDYLMKVAGLADFDPTLVANYLSVFIECVGSNNGKVVVMQQSELLATVSTSYLFLALHHLLVTDPTSDTLADIRRRYNRIFPVDTKFDGLPPFHPVVGIHALVNPDWSPRNTRWANRRLSSQQHIPSAHNMVKVAQVGYQKTQNRKVPRWTLRFAFYSLSLDPPPPTSIIADCLTIAAIDLGCDILNIASRDKVYVFGFHGCSWFSPSTSAQVGLISSLITQKLRSMIEDADMELVRSKCKAMCTVLPYSVFLEQGGQQAMLDAISDAFRASNRWWPIWDHAQPYLRSLLSRPNNPSLHRAITLTSPHVDWRSGLCDKSMFSRWVAAASAVSYTEAVDQSVVDTLLQIANVDFLRPRIPVGIWTLLKKRPSLPPVCQGRYRGTSFDIVHQIRGLGDIEILKSYFLLVWSEWERFRYSCLQEMVIAISEDFGGIGVWRHRKDLIERLDCILEQLDQGEEFLHQHNPSIIGGHAQMAKMGYGELKERLLEVDRKAMETLTRTSPKSGYLKEHTNPQGHTQDPIRPSAVLCPFCASNFYLELLVLSR